MHWIDRAVLFALLMGIAPLLHAQEEAAAHTIPSVPSQPSSATTEVSSHKFWDAKNAWLFAGVGGGRMLDYASTRYFRGRGNPETLLTNAVVDNKPLFVGIELAGTAASVAVSYIFHRTGHHRVERWVSILHIGAAVGGSIRNYNLKPPAPKP